MRTSPRPPLVIPAKAKPRAGIFVSINPDVPLDVTSLINQRSRIFLAKFRDDSLFGSKP